MLLLGCYLKTGSGCDEHAGAYVTVLQTCVAALLRLPIQKGRPQSLRKVVFLALC